MILPPEVPVEYAEVLKQYREIVRIIETDFEKAYYEDTIPVPNGAENYDWFAMLIDGARWSGKLGYVVQDINTDGIPELFWVGEDHDLLAIFTISNGKAINVGAFRPKYWAIVTEDNEIQAYATCGADSGVDYIMFLPAKSDRLQIKNMIYQDSYYDKDGRPVSAYYKYTWSGELMQPNYVETWEDRVNKVAITEEEYLAFREQYPLRWEATESWKQNKIHFIN